MKKESSVITSLHRASNQRLDAALEIVKQKQFRLEAIYLAGYVAEIDLKCLILSHTPATERASRCERFKRYERHDLDALLKSVRKLGRTIPSRIQRELLFISTWWSTELRYQVGLMMHVDIKRFFDSVRLIHGWVKDSIA